LRVHEDGKQLYELYAIPPSSCSAVFLSFKSPCSVTGLQWVHLNEFLLSEVGSEKVEFLSV
jgi:hypothetical protein